MNTNQKVATGAGVFLVTASLVFAPWEIQEKTRGGYVFATHSEFAPVIVPPSTHTPDTYRTNFARLRIECLLAEWCGLGILYLGVLALLKRQPTRDV
jgi:hypothetical protein